MGIKSAVTMLGALMLATSPAWAVTGTNQGKQDHTFTVDHGAQENDHKIGAGASVQVDCKDGCAVRMRSGPAGYDRMASTNDKLLINEKGFLLYADEELVTGSVEEKATSKPAKTGNTTQQ